MSAGVLDGRVAVVTGGTSGIGLGMARGLAAAGAAVALWGRDPDRAERARAGLAAAGGTALAIACDVGDPDAVERAFTATTDAFGRVDCAIANAGTGPDGTPFLELGIDEVRRVLRTNLEGAFLTFQGAARRMAAQGTGGSLVAVSSLAAVQGQVRGQHYAASKAGLLGLVRSCAVELARHGIRANAVLPGWIETPLTDGLLDAPAVEARVLPRVPARRWGTPDDFGALAVYLASDGSLYHTGDELVVDGGYRIF